MKKIISIITSVLVFFTVFQTYAFARAGGGGGSGGGGGGGFFRFGRHSRVNIFERIGTADSVMEFALCIVVLILETAAILLAVYLSIVVFLKLKSLRFKSRILLEKLSKTDPVWNPKNFDKHVRYSLYKIQQAWSDDNIFSVRELMSDTLYEDFSKKLELNRKDNIQNRLSEIKLINAYPISVQDRIGDDNDCIWYYIKASMVDINVDKTTMRTLSGSKTPVVFVEYWRFCKKDGSWVFDKIASK